MDGGKRLYVFTRGALGVGFALLFAGAVCGVGLWMVDASRIKAFLDSLAPDGTADDFPLARVAAMQVRALFGALVAVVAAGELWIWRGWVDGLVRAAVGAFRVGFGWAISVLGWDIWFVTLIGALGRVGYLWQPMRVDEATTFLEFVSKPLLLGLSYYPAPNNHILHTLLAHFVVSLFGMEPWAVRLVAFLAGVAMIPAAAVAASALQGRMAARPAACLVALAWPWVFYSANARGYTLVGLLYLVLVAICCRLRRERELGAWIWFVVCAALGLFAVPVMAYALPPLCLWVLLGRPAAWRELVVATLGTVVLTLCLYAPALAASGYAAAVTPEMTAAPVGGAWERIGRFGMLLWANWHAGLPVMVWVGLLVAAGVGWRFGSLAGISLLCFVGWLAVWPVMPYTRVWLWLSLPWFLLAAGGLGRLAERWRCVGVALICVTTWQLVRVWRMGSIGASNETGTFRAAPEAVRELKPLWRAGDRVRVEGSMAPVLYEMRRQGVGEPGRGGRVWVIDRAGRRVE